MHQSAIKALIHSSICDRAKDIQLATTSKVHAWVHAVTCGNFFDVNIEILGIRGKIFT